MHQPELHPLFAPRQDRQGLQTQHQGQGRAGEPRVRAPGATRATAAGSRPRGEPVPPHRGRAGRAQASLPAATRPARPRRPQRTPILPTGCQAAPTFSPHPGPGPRPRPRPSALSPRPPDPGPQRPAPGPQPSVPGPQFSAPRPGPQPPALDPRPPTLKPSPRPSALGLGTHRAGAARTPPARSSPRAAPWRGTRGGPRGAGGLRGSGTRGRRAHGPAPALDRAPRTPRVRSAAAAAARAPAAIFPASRPARARRAPACCRPALSGRGLQPRISIGPEGTRAAPRPSLPTLGPGHRPSSREPGLRLRRV